MTLKQGTDFIHRVEMQDYRHKTFDMEVDRVDETCPRGLRLRCTECDHIRVILNGSVFTHEIPMHTDERNYSYCLDVGVSDVRSLVFDSTAVLTLDDQVIATEELTFGWQNRLANQFTQWIFSLYYKKPN